MGDGPYLLAHNIHNAFHKMFFRYEHEETGSEPCTRNINNI